MSEFKLGRMEVAMIARQLGYKSSQSAVGLQRDVLIPFNLPGFSDDAVSEFTALLRRFVAMRIRRSSDWYRFLLQINNIIVRSRHGLRSTTAILNEGDDWMRWHAPPDDLEGRTRDTVSLLVAADEGRLPISAVFPCLVLLHPFGDGNCRTALGFLHGVNEVNNLCPREVVNAFCSTVRIKRMELIEALSQIRIAGDTHAYARFVGTSFNFS
jgi:hypothetical protein